LPQVDQAGNAYRQYLGLRPEMEALGTSSQRGRMGIDGAVGLQVVANPRLNKSIGIPYESSARVMDARVAKDSSKPSASIGLGISSNMINQVMMGVWEAGVLVQQFNTGNFAFNTFVNNVDVTFKTITPWTIDLIEGNDPKRLFGNVQLAIEDLEVSFVGDIFIGYWLYDFEFLKMEISLESIVELGTELGGLGVEFGVQPEVTLKTFQSNGISINKSLGDPILEWLVPIVTDQLSTFSFNLPETDDQAL